MILHDLYHAKLLDCPKWIINNLVFCTKAGSTMYGINTTSSDIDIIGITMPLKSHIFPHLDGLIYGFDKFEPFNQFQKHHIDFENKEYDVTIYGLVHFFKMALENNPNIIELLFAPQDCLLYNTPIFQKVLDKRQLFLSKLAYHKFQGYAFSNWHKLQGKDPEGKRKELIEKYGYDVKFAAHTFRLLNAAICILSSGTLNIRIGAEFSNDIRKGIYSLEYLTAQLELMKEKLQIEYNKSSLNETPDKTRIRQLLWEVLEIQYEGIRQRDFSSENLVLELEELVLKYKKG